MSFFFEIVSILPQINSKDYYIGLLGRVIEGILNNNL